MISTTILAVYALGIILAPGPTRAVLKALTPLIGMLAIVLFLFWRIFPGATGTLRRF